MRATWRSTRDPRGRIEVSSVCDTNAEPEHVRRFERGTDLADARELCPKWNRLWDSVQHEFWADIAAAAGSAPGPGRESFR
ncbi:hypothetical protein NONO_c10500 [Nocardia nova SH22a]|uniref:Uncharacterized protein n=1 Tax=Nocardia nova SH22a TaxID=1415166 RepID=W5T9J1_9NOCA|nr:hypothetical protein NONO_c10500 [Nocardia nova SH22a]